MLSSLPDRPRRPRRVIAAAWVLAVSLPFVASACITVNDDAGAGASGGPSVTPGASGPPGDPAAVTPRPRPTPVPTPEHVEAEVVGFLPNWLVEDAALALDSDLLTVLAFHGIEASGDGRLVTTKPSGDVPEGWQALDSDEFVALKAQGPGRGRQGRAHDPALRLDRRPARTDPRTARPRPGTDGHWQGGSPSS